MTIKRTNYGLGLPAGLPFSFASEANGTCVNSWWRQEFPDRSTAPARFTFQAGALPFGAKIEIQAVAARGT